MSKDLRQFLKKVKEMGPNYYVELNQPLKPKYEPCIIQEKLAREGRYPVIYCPQIEGSKLPLVTNLFSCYDMLGLALDIDTKKMGRDEVLKEFRRRIADRKAPVMIPASESPVKEVIYKGDDVDLNILPIIHHQEGDSGKYLDIGCLVCKDPDTGIYNAGVYRHELKGKNQLGFMTSPNHKTAYIARRYAELKRSFEVVITVGHHPAVGIGACTFVRLGINKLEVIGGLLKEPLAMTQAETVSIPVPAFGEIVIEGEVDPCAMVTDGPFAEYTGYYGGGNKSCYLIKVKAVTMRKDAIYNDLDPASLEHNRPTSLGMESNDYDVIQKAVPTVKSVYLPRTGRGFLTFVSIKKRIEGEGKFAGLAAVSARPSSKIVIVVDEDIDIYDYDAVWWAVATRVEADTSVSIIPGVSGAHLDPSAYGETRFNKGSMTTKMIIDATRPVNTPFAPRITPPKAVWESMVLENYLKDVHKKSKDR
jgi:2,5-furandicarboxylate decarboxylase 1